MAGRVTTGDPGRHLLDRIDAREQALARQAEQAQAAIDEAAARLRELRQEISDLQVTRKTLLSLAGHDDPPPAAEPAPSPDPPEHPAYRQIMDAFADQQRPLRARDLCTALDLPVAAKHVEGIRSKLKRLASRGILTETEPGLLTQPRP
jgi:outer membrane protein TolC